MKNLFTLLLLVATTFIYGQNIAFDFAFIKAEDIGAYDQNLKLKFQKMNQNYIDDGRIYGWHVWKVINGAQTPFTHLAVSIYDLDKMDENYQGKKWTEVFPDFAQNELQDWGRKNAENRKIIFETQMVNVADVLKKGVAEYPDIAVMNFMKVKDGKYKSYEDAEKSFTKSISKTDAREGWSFAKRIDRMGTDLSWTHFTVDWYEKYSDFLKEGAKPSYDADTVYDNISKLRDLKDRVVLKKFIFLNK